MFEASAVLLRHALATDDRELWGADGARGEVVDDRHVDAGRFDVTVDLLPGLAARDADGRAVRRVMTAGNADGLMPARDLSGVLDPAAAWVDAQIYGDAWVDEAGARVDPTVVVVVVVEGPVPGTSGS